ncbi:hypothetical protein HY025_02190 [Candidatus Daviesbacteria bacterium]|nr:hypothetical protein [Candidatus Daviesbacteria bacterium]
MNDDQKHKQAKAVEEVGDEDASGTMADLESDDDMLENAHKAGLYEKSDDEHPEELNVAKEVENAEKVHIKED